MTRSAAAPAKLGRLRRLRASQFARQIGAADIAEEHRLLFDSILDPAAADGGASANQARPLPLASTQLT